MPEHQFNPELLTQCPLQLSSGGQGKAMIEFGQSFLREAPQADDRIF